MVSMDETVKFPSLDASESGTRASSRELRPAMQDPVPGPSLALKDISPLATDGSGDADSDAHIPWDYEEDTFFDMCPYGTRTERIFLLSNYNEYDRKKITNMIYALGGSVADIGEDFKATHLVVPYFKITRKMIAALAAGLWIVQTSYILRSYKTGRWELEAAYEVGSPSCPYYVLSECGIDPGVDIYFNAPRMCREKALVKRKPNLFNWKVALVMDDPRDRLCTEWLLKAGGAYVEVYKLPLKSNIDKKAIDFAIVDIRDMSSINFFLRHRIPCVSDEFIADSLCQDPPPDISQYDLRNCHEEKYSSNAPNSHDAPCYCSTKRKKYQGRVGRCHKKFSTLLEKTAENEMMHFHGKDKFKITLSRQCMCSKLLMNSELYLNFDISGNVGLDNNANALKVLIKNRCEGNLNIGSYPNNELKMKSSCDECVGDSGEFNMMKINERALSESPSRKRLTSPRFLSPGKRKKTFPIQGNTLDNYFTPQNMSDEKHLTDYGKEYQDHHISNVCSPHYRNAAHVHCSVSNDNESNSKEVLPKPPPPELIVLSSDEDDDSTHPKHISEVSKVSPEIYILSGKHGENLVQENSSQNGLRNLQYVDKKGDIFKRESIVLQSSPVIVISSDEDENENVSMNSKVIDLTCDDYEGDVVVYEHSLLEKRVQSDSGKQGVESSLSVSDTSKNLSTVSPTKLEMKNFLKNKKIEKINEMSISHPNVEQSHPVNFVEMNRRLSGSELCARSECNFRNNNFCSDRYHEDHARFSELDFSHPPCIPCVESVVDIIDVKNCKPRFKKVNKAPEKYTFSTSSPNKFKNIDETINSVSPDQRSDLDVIVEPLPALDENLNSNSLVSPTKGDETTCAKSIDLKQTNLGDANLAATTSNYCNEVESDLEKDELKEVSSASPSKSSSETSDNTSFEMLHQQNHSEGHKHKVSPKLKFLSADEVCEIQAGVYYSKLDRPWIEIGAFYTPQCVVNGPSDCNLVHGKKKVSIEQEHYDENFLLDAVCPSSAIELLQRRIDCKMYPSSSLVQYTLFCVMERWNDIGIDALLCLHQLLEMHPPCAHGMLDYYKKIFFSSIDNVQIQVSDGVFWYCLTKIELALNSSKCQPESSPRSPSQSPLREESLENIIFPIINRTNRGFQGTFQAVKLEQLFNCLDYFIDVMEADLDVGLLKNMSNGRRYMCKNSKPLIAVAFWRNHMIGSVTARCKQLIKIYFRCIRQKSTNVFTLSLNRLLSMVAAVIYASERNTQHKYPNVGINCKEFSSIFSSILLESDLNMIEVSSMLNFLKPDWFRWLVCCSLIEKLYGRNMDLALQPAIQLLKNLWAVKQEFPDPEQQSRLILSDMGSELAVNGNCLEISPSLLKSATKKDKRGETRLHVTCRLNRFNEVEELLSVPNININEKDNDGWTPLHEAALHGSIECIQLLLNHRTPSGGPSIDLRAKNSRGITPLMDAVKRNHLNVAALLLEYGGRELLSDTDEMGYSVFDLVLTEEMRDILNNAPDNSKWNVLSAIPMTLRLKLVILIPQIILFYMKFSEVRKIASYLVNKDSEFSRTGTVSFKFKPLTFKQDYKDLKKLKTLVKKMLNLNFALVDRLIFIL